METDRDDDWGHELLIVADTPWSVAAARSAAEAAGIPPLGRMAIAAAADWLTERPGIDAVLVEIATDGGAAMDALLDLVDRRVRSGRLAAVVTLSPELIDPVTARISPGVATLLCDPGTVERVAALRLALALRDHGPGANVAERGDSGATMRLRALSAEAGRIAEALAEIANERDGLARRAPLRLRDAAVDFVATASPDAPSIRRMIAQRRLRDRFFEPGLFEEPEWDMLLDLMAARIEGKTVSVSSLCIAAAVPQSTALRAIGGMTAAGLFERHPDPGDARRVLMRLSDPAAAAMTRYLAAIS